MASLDMEHPQAQQIMINYQTLLSHIHTGGDSEALPRLLTQEEQNDNIEDIPFRKGCHKEACCKTDTLVTHLSMVLCMNSSVTFGLIQRLAQSPLYDSLNRSSLFSLLLPYKSVVHWLKVRPSLR